MVVLRTANANRINSIAHNPQPENNSLIAQLNIGLSISPIAQNNSPIQQETSTRLAPVRKMFFMLNKKLLSHNPNAPILSTLSQEPLEGFIRVVWLTTLLSSSESIESSKFTLIVNRREIVKKKLIAFLKDDDGLTIVEYAVAAGLITATVALAFQALGGTVEGIINTVEGYLNP
jgi:pilus assembly protein Flp/PilA